MVTEQEKEEMRQYEEDCTVADAARIIAHRIKSGKDLNALEQFTDQVVNYGKGVASED